MSKKLWSFLILLLITASCHSSCPCFHRFYLYSIFSSEKPTVSCEGTGPGFYNRVYIRSDSAERGRQPSNFGEASSTEYRCMLRVDNQSITVNYSSKAQKYSCDHEITRACFCLSRYKENMTGVSCL